LTQPIGENFGLFKKDYSGHFASYYFRRAKKAHSQNKTVIQPPCQISTKVMNLQVQFGKKIFRPNWIFSFMFDNALLNP
jgi:hypothetical protein